MFFETKTYEKRQILVENSLKYMNCVQKKTTSLHFH